MIECEGQGCVVRSRERSAGELSGALANYRIPRRGDFDRRALARGSYGRVGSIYGPATDKIQRRPGRGRIEKQSREFRDVGSARLLLFLARVEIRRRRRRRRCRAAASVSVNSEWVSGEWVTCRSGDSPRDRHDRRLADLVSRSFLLRGARTSAVLSTASCNRQNRWRPDVLHDGRGPAVPRGSRDADPHVDDRRWRARNRRGTRAGWSREISRSSTFR